ncbi:unnamed protein product, partial [Heterosigma akashiwo]
PAPARGLAARPRRGGGDRGLGPHGGADPGGARAGLRAQLPRAAGSGRPGRLPAQRARAPLPAHVRRARGAGPAGGGAGGLRGRAQRG